MDLAKAIAPECDIRIMGIRAGEKLHETLISGDEAHHSVELKDMFIIKPLHRWWNAENWSEARSLPDGFEYSSDKNTEWMTVDHLRKVIGNAENI